MMRAMAVAEQAARYPEPDRRPLQVFAFDPMVARLSGQETTTISVPYEPLSPGPSGELIQVIDYDSVASIRGLDIAITTSAETDDQARALLRHLGLPFATESRRD